MASKAPSNQGGSSSGISDVKYQKAIKQISKLISLNTALKNDYLKLQQKYDKLQQDYESLQEKMNSSEHATNNDTLATEPQHEMRMPQSSISKIFKDEQGSQDIQQFVEQKKKIEQLQEKLKEKDEKIAKLKQDIQTRAKQNEELKAKQIDMSEELARMKQVESLFKQSQTSDKEALKLKKQLQKSEQLVKKISSDYEFLKKQLLFNEKSSINAKSIEMNNTSVSSPLGSLRDPLSDFYLQKLRKSESDNIRLRKELNDKRLRWKKNVEKLKEDSSEQVKKLIHLTNFVEKQQAFIEKFVLDKPQSVQIF